MDGLLKSTELIPKPGAVFVVAFFCCACLLFTVLLVRDAFIFGRRRINPSAFSGFATIISFGGFFLHPLAPVAILVNLLLVYLFGFYLFPLRRPDH